MTPQDQQLIEARLDVKVADIKGDVRLNTQGFAELRARFDEFAAKMATVPVDLAIVRTKVENLPSKGFVVTASVTSITALTAILVLFQKLGLLH